VAGAARVAKEVGKLKLCCGRGTQTDTVCCGSCGGAEEKARGELRNRADRPYGTARPAGRAVPRGGRAEGPQGPQRALKVPQGPQRDAEGPKATSEPPNSIKPLTSISEVETKRCCPSSWTPTLRTEELGSWI